MVDEQVNSKKNRNLRLVEPEGIGQMSVEVAGRSRLLRRGERRKSESKPNTGVEISKPTPYIHKDCRRQTKTILRKSGALWTI
jgi:hypothetical protein